MSSLFKRRSQTSSNAAQSSRPAEPSLLDIDDPAQLSSPMPIQAARAQLSSTMPIQAARGSQSNAPQSAGRAMQSTIAPSAGHATQQDIASSVPRSAGHATQQNVVSPVPLSAGHPTQQQNIASPVPLSAGTTKAVAKSSFLNWSGSKKPQMQIDRQALSRSQSPKAATAASGVLTSPLTASSIASPRISTSSRTSIFERSVDSLPSENLSGVLVDPTHSQLLIDNQIPSVLDASVEAITSNEDLNRVEIVTAQPTLVENLSVPVMDNPWSEAENISTAHAPIHSAAAKRLSFVSYADLLGVEQAEAEAVSLHSQKSGDSRPLSPESTGLAPPRPQSTPTDTMTTRRQKSIITLGQTADLELTRSTMADTILAPVHSFENVNPWA